MKAIMISIKPKYVAKILNGEKTIEIRKTKPKCDLPIEVYIYCTKGKNLYPVLNFPDRRGNHNLKPFEDYHLGECSGVSLNGKVVAKFTLNKVSKINYQEEETEHTRWFNKVTCLTDDELDKYLNKKTGYAWHIDNLEIFDKPKELSEFKRCTEKTCIYGKCHKYMHCLKSLTKAPQSWCYVEAN